MKKASFVPPVGSLPKIIGAVLVIGVIALIFLSTSVVSISFMSDSSATSSFTIFTKKMSSACSMGADVLSNFEFSSSSVDRYYAIGIVSSSFSSTRLDTKSLSKVKSCVEGDNICLCLFRMDTSAEVLYDTSSSSHNCPLLANGVLSESISTYSVGDGIDKVDRWSYSLGKDIDKTYGDINVKVLQCKSLKRMGCTFKDDSGAEQPLLLMKENQLFLWFQTLSRGYDYSKSEYYYDTGVGPMSINLNLPVYHSSNEKYIKIEITPNVWYSEHPSSNPNIFTIYESKERSCLDGQY